MYSRLRVCPNRKLHCTSRVIAIAVRTLLASVFFVLATIFGGMNHLCALGYKTFEFYETLGAGVVVFCIVFFVRRYRFGIPAAVLSFLAWGFLVLGPYLEWVHDPKNPVFAELRAKIHPSKLRDR